MDTSTSTSHKKACVTCAQEFEGQEDSCPFDGTKLTVISEQLIIGTVLGGRYEIMAMVADGGMGKVYKARHKLMNRLVAIKTMLPSVVSSGTALKRFQQEAEAVSLLNHPNILTIYDFFISDDGQPYLVMDYLEGSNLGELLKKENGKLDPVLALPIFIMVCAGLGHAHERGIVHRDIKPGNIMLIEYEGKPNFAKIIDFGIAKLTPGENEQRSQLTATGDIFGSPQFMSPEQCRALPLDARSDIYSFGCVMYVALTGISPFGGQDPIESMFKQVHDEPPSLKRADPNLTLPEGLEKIIMKAIAKEPEGRYQSMNEMRIALEEVYAALPEASPDYINQFKATIASVGQSRQVAQTHGELPKISKPFYKNAKQVIAKAIGYWQKLSRNIQISTIIFLVAIGCLCWFYEVRHQTVINKIQELQNTNQQSTSPVNVQNQSPEQAYSQDLQQGKEAYKAGNYTQAEKLFIAAHKAAENFGQRDPRYVDSLELDGMTEYQLGNYQGAKQALVYVIYVDKNRYGSNSSKVLTAKKELSEVLRALNQK